VVGQAVKSNGMLYMSGSIGLVPQVRMLHATCTLALLFQRMLSAGDLALRR
jgi:enamine deaminase RidA (YjgF/YER057c/UK114 family)